jgi:hypothetical protein
MKRDMGGINERSAGTGRQAEGGWVLIPVENAVAGNAFRPHTHLCKGLAVETGVPMPNHLIGGCACAGG